jgi:hypothetical protein
MRFRLLFLFLQPFGGQHGLVFHVSNEQAFHHSFLLTFAAPGKDNKIVKVSGKLWPVFTGFLCDWHTAKA